jgi:hypothetical protein
MSVSRQTGFKIAVISDLHVGDARAKDLYPGNLEGARQAARDVVVDQNYVDTFIAFLASNDLRADYLLVPGDVSHGGKPAQIAHAARVIRRCADALAIPADRVLFVPGNHDVNWDVLQLELDDGSGVLGRLRYCGFVEDEPVFRVIGTGVFEEPFFALWADEALYVVAYNTAWRDGPDVTAPHHGYVEPAHLDEIRRKMDAQPPNESQVRLFLLHHHPDSYFEPDGHPDFSELQHSSELKRLLFERGFHLVVHGHKHIPKVRPLWHGVGDMLALLCAGSFSARMYPAWHHKVANQFHIIELAPGVQVPVAGIVRSWSYITAHGWIPSRRDWTGIGHVEPFGSYPDSTSLAADLRGLIVEGFRQGTHISCAEWSQVDRRLQYVNQDQLRHALNSLAAELEFDIMESKDDSLVLVKGRR